MRRQLILVPLIGSLLGMAACIPREVHRLGTDGGTGSGGQTNGSGGSADGSGGTTGSGGSAAGSGGSGSGGSADGSGGTTGSGGSAAGSGGSADGSGGTTGSGGSAAGSGGTTGSGGQTNGSGGSGSGGSAPLPTTFDNPIIKYDAVDPTLGPGSTIFTADGAAMVWNDKVYLYTGHDEQVQGTDGYRMFDWRLWVSSDLVKWENKGAIAHYKTFAWARGGTNTGNANAIQVVERNDQTGKARFYLYAPVEGGQSGYGISIGVAVADAPEGPFKDARGIPLIFLADTEGISSATHSWRNLGPTVFVDDDGQAYIYWGNGILYWALLADDMIHLKGETYSVDGTGIMTNRSLGTAKINVISTMTNYTEAPWLSKHGSLYYLSYAAGMPQNISYATSSSPAGPWQYRGVVIDPVSNSTTVHQSLFDFRGASFMTYQNGALPTGGNYRRSVCIDRIYYNTDGTMKKLVQTKK